MKKVLASAIAILFSAILFYVCLPQANKIFCKDMHPAVWCAQFTSLILVVASIYHKGSLRAAFAISSLDMLLFSMLYAVGDNACKAGMTMFSAIAIILSCCAYDLIRKCLETDGTENLKSKFHWWIAAQTFLTLVFFGIYLQIYPF